MDAISIVLYLLHYGIISSGDSEAVRQAVDSRHQAERLYACLKYKCTTEALMQVCDITINVKGNPRMSVLGKDMRRALEIGPCCVGGRVCLCMGVCMW